MIKILGSFLVLLGGGIVWNQGKMERQHRRKILCDLLVSLRSMTEEIRMARTPLPDLLETLEQGCGEDAARFFAAVVRRIRQGDRLKCAWEQEAKKLPLSQTVQEAVFRIGESLERDEESICKAISLAIYKLAEVNEAEEQQCRQEEKRIAAMHFSTAALLVILLI